MRKPGAAFGCRDGFRVKSTGVAVEHSRRFVMSDFHSANIAKKVKDYPHFEAKKTVKKTSRLKRGVYRAGNIGRQSRPLGQIERFFFLKIRGRSSRENLGPEIARLCVFFTWPRENALQKSSPFG